MPAAPISLSASAGPSQAGSDAESSAAVGTGSFIINRKQNPWADALKATAPFIVLGLFYWIATRK